MLHALAAGRRRARLARLRRLRALAVGDRRDPHLAPDARPLPARGARLAVSRPARSRPGVAIGLAGAIKFFLWPLGVWLAAIGRRTAAATAVAIAGGSILLVLPFTGLDDYVRVLLELGRTFDQESYNPYGLLVQAGARPTVGRVVTLVLGAALLVGCWRRQSLALAVAAALVLSPIVWLDYYAVAAIPLAAVRPRLSRGVVRAARHLGPAERGDRRRATRGAASG